MATWGPRVGANPRDGRFRPGEVVGPIPKCAVSGPQQRDILLPSVLGSSPLCAGLRAGAVPWRRRASGAHPLVDAVHQLTDWQGFHVQVGESAFLEGGAVVGH